MIKLLIVVIASLLVGCGDRAAMITAEAIDEATKACKEHGEVRWIITDTVVVAGTAPIPATFHCTDYAQFTINNKGERLP